MNFVQNSRNKIRMECTFENEPDAIPDEEIYPHMNGNFVFKHAVTRFPETIHEALEKLVKSRRS